MADRDEWSESDLSDLTDSEVDQLEDDEDASASYREHAPKKKREPVKATPIKSMLLPPRTSQFSVESLYSALSVIQEGRRRLT
jgi:hypothetical protein